MTEVNQGKKLYCREFFTEEKYSCESMCLLLVSVLETWTGMWIQTSQLPHLIPASEQIKSRERLQRNPHFPVTGLHLLFPLPVRL